MTRVSFNTQASTATHTQHERSHSTRQSHDSHVTKLHNGHMTRQTVIRQSHDKTPHGHMMKSHMTRQTNYTTKYACHMTQEVVKHQDRLLQGPVHGNTQPGTFRFSFEPGSQARQYIAHTPGQTPPFQRVLVQTRPQLSDKIFFATSWVESLNVYIFILFQRGLAV